MARSLIIFTLAVMCLVAMASSAKPPPKKKDLGHNICLGKVNCKDTKKPIAGATVKITCVGDTAGTGRSNVTTVSNPTNAKGEYVVAIPVFLEDGTKLIHCKIALNSSPDKTCKTPTDVNGGKKGAPLAKFLNTKNIHDRIFLFKDFSYSK